MRVIVQRVKKASLYISGETRASIGLGLVILVGIEHEDDHSDIQWLSQKITQLRIFRDLDGKMNLSVKDIEGELLVVSQFTLHASTKKGHRPSFLKSAKPDQAIPIYESFKKQLSADLGKEVASGVFGADMDVNLINHGPVTISIDSRARE